MCGCLPALRRGLPAIVAGLRLAISAVVVLSLNVLGKLISLPAPASRFAFPGEPLLQASVRTGDIADRCAELPEKDHERRHEPERGVHFEVLIRRANNATGGIRQYPG